MALEEAVIIVFGTKIRTVGPFPLYHHHRHHHDLFTRLLLLVHLCISFIVVSSNAEMVCQRGVQNFAGVTYPPGDIILQEGDPLDVYCSVNLTHPKARGYNASHLEFVIRKYEIPEEVIHREIINETTIHMRVKNMNASIAYVDCMVRKEDGSSVQVCQNHVEVGYQPLPVEDFSCRAWNWTKLVCSWRRPYNPISTKYHLSFIVSKRYEYFCPETLDHSNGTYSCEWNKHDPPYKPNEKRYYLKMNGTNALNKSGVIWYNQIDHYSIVIPEPPKMRYIAVLSTHTLRLNWTFKNFEHFPPGLEHELTVCSEYGDCNQTIRTTETSVSHVTQDIQVPHAFTNYTVTVRMRSRTANKTEEFWSSPATAMARTLAKVPDSPPRTVIGSFEIYRNKLQHRDVYVYWENLEPSKRNGPHFHYHVVLYEDDRKSDIQPLEINWAYAKFVNLSDNMQYAVEVYAVNDVGRSAEKSTVVIPSSENAPEEPQRVSRLDYANGTYEVSWTPPLNHDNIISYTVFRCNHKRPRPHQCNGLLKWDVVPAGKGSPVVYHNLSTHSGEVVQFAVSANTDKYSSGMMWASCSLIPDKVPDKLKPVDVVEAKEDQLRIEWELDCSYQEGVIEGFRIAYCEVDDDQKCMDGEKSAFTLEKKTYTLKNLQPFSKYKIAISVQTKAGESQQSTPRISSTSEAAPSDPPILTPVEVRNTSIVVKIRPPNTPNGIIRRYEVLLNASTSQNDRSFSPRIIEVGNYESLEELLRELPDLESNTVYAIRVSACTIKCSAKSEPINVTTKIGATNMVKAPSLSYTNGNFKISWHVPNHLGGPVSRFQVMVKQSGKQVNETYVNYDEGTDGGIDCSAYSAITSIHSMSLSDLSNYVKEIKMHCESNTNLTAKIRAVTVLENGDELIGGWSQEGYVACVGTSGWIFLLIGGIVLLVVVVLLVIVGHKFWSCYVDCRYGIEPKLPPGLEKELYPCNPVHTRRANPMDDMQPYSKDNLSTSPLKYVSSTNIDEEQGILTSSQNNHEVKGCLGDSRMSPSALNPLLSDRSNVTDDEEYSKPESSNVQNEPYKKLGMFGNGSIVINDGKSSGQPVDADSVRADQAVPVMAPTQSDYAAQGMDDVFSSTSASTVSSLTPSSPEKLCSTSRIVPDVLTTNNASSYVRWTQLLPDFKNDAIANRQNPSYCQVGII